MADIANIENMATKLAAALTEYDQEVADKVKDIVDEQADEAVSELRARSPRKTGQYAKGWKKKQAYESRTTKRNTAYNSKKHQLTHLLEKPHKRKNTDRAGVVHTSKTAITAARVHIAPVEKRTIREMEEKIKKAVKS